MGEIQMIRPGERVAVYGYQEHDVGATVMHRWKATVKEIRPDGLLIVTGEDADGERSMTVHPKQCRRLRKRPVTREWIIKGHPSACSGNYVHKPILGPALALDEQVRVREVRTKKS